MNQRTDALAIARQVVSRASELLRDAQREVGEIRHKSGIRDLVTEWDHRSEELIVGELERLSPGMPILGEEGGAREGSRGREVWLVDPIDGTVNFSHGLPWFAVTVALEIDGVAVAGVVACPVLGLEFYAAEGEGAWLCTRDEDLPLAVSQIESLDRSILATGFPTDRATTGHNFAEWEHLQRNAGACRRFGAASLDLAMVARGWLDGYWESRLSPWDISAGALLVKEAGGKVCDLVGGPFVSQSGQVVASNGRIHEELLRQLEVVRGRGPSPHGGC